MPVVLVLLTTMPLVPALAAFAGRTRVTGGLSVLTGITSLALAISLVPAVVHGPARFGFLRADAVSVVFLLATTFLYAAAAVYSIGYLGSEKDTVGAGRYALRFYLGLNLFAWSMMCAPLMDGLALLWIAVEITTVVSALLVALDNTDRAAEAAWKYVLLASAGLGIGLLATIVMYYAGSTVLGGSYDLAFAPLLATGAALPHTAVQLAYVLAVVGFGTKVGLFPVHTWLPDAHSEAPTPVSAMLSGSLLAVSFYALLRYYQVAAATLGPSFPRTVLLVFGVLSLLLAALYLLEQRDLKRLLAYSSVEHMGILAIGIGLGAPPAIAGVLLHVIAHAAAKGNAFFGAGVLVRKYGTKDVATIRSGLTTLPWTAPLFLLAILALSAMPPFGLFRSEFQIVAGGLGAAHNTVTVVLVVLVTIAFLGLSVATTRMLFVPGADAPVRGEPSGWMVAPMLAGFAVLLVLGIHPPADFANLLARGVTELGGGT
ncbi:proton-conducting transporter transmembrane domain-containing protein [Amycolatopsis nalaikhensis]|uniref:Proton-conducting transporter membrane subunit n=1 Tax=Amycolatopsis nalaikhensis TaxID=715472 RepID=A0ABY8XTX0_9PSEU|nr:proton-conducting transporter membrane subunit [Amycolatopsis sp. 2-2]WIV59134.1 proton-conducting transporter membrane subunit [Amycolatopsis sp. 2-2]